MAQLLDTNIAGSLTVTGDETLNGSCYAGQFYEITSAPVSPTQTTISGNTATLNKDNWSNNSQIITVLGVTPSNIIIVAPAPGSLNYYAMAEVQCVAQGNNSLTFNCTTTPTNNININVIMI